MPISGSWSGLALKLREQGIEPVSSEPSTAAAHLVVIEYVKGDEKNWPKVPKRCRYLVPSEPVAVNPVQYSRRVARKFHSVIVASLTPANGRNYIYYEAGRMNPNLFGRAFSNDGDRTGSVLLNEHKFSFVRSSNYLLRSTFLLAAMNQGLDITLAGRNWDRGAAWVLAKVAFHIIEAAKAGKLHLRLRTLWDHARVFLARRRIREIYAGEVENSVQFQSKFKVSIVIENESSFVSTEKLHGALAAGCQCVYVGPPINPADFPPNFLFLSGPRPDDLVSALRSALAAPYSITAEEIQNFVETSPYFRANNVEKRNQVIADILGQMIGGFLAPKTGK